MFKVTVLVHYLESVVNPDEEVFKGILEKKNINQVSSVKMGRTYILDIETKDKDDARATGEKLAKEFIFNPAMETYSITVEEA